MEKYSPRKKDVRGQWTQKVYQVDDSPRYEGSSTWVHLILHYQGVSIRNVMIIT